MRQRRETPRGAPVSAGGAGIGGVAGSIGGLACGGLVAVAVGVALLVITFAAGRMVIDFARAQFFTPVPCEVVACELETHTDSDGDSSYSIAITFAYEWEGGRRIAHRYDPIGGSSGFRASLERVVARNRPGTRAVCYVNPKNPAEAVFDRSFTPFLLILLLPPLFALAGVVWVVQRWWWPPPFHARPEAWLPDLPSPPDAPVRLVPGNSPGWAFLAALGVALFWNGIVGVFASQLLDGYRAGERVGVSALLLSPFALIGIFLGLGALHAGLALLNPVPRLAIRPGRLRVGERVELGWRIEGWPRLTRLRIKLEGREEATYEQGTSTTTDHRDFCSELVVESDDPQRIAAGVAELRVPPGMMHSLDLKCNRVTWRLTLAAVIPRWPDINAEFPVLVWPEGRPRDGELV